MHRYSPVSYTHLARRAQKAALDDGKVKPGDTIRLMATGAEFTVVECGFLRRDANHVLYFIDYALRVGAWQIDFIDDRDDFQPDVYKRQARDGYF